jgi:translation initiation factor 2 beta subunit (eIF-2beta)/eIF-5
MIVKKITDAIQDSINYNNLPIEIAIYENHTIEDVLNIVKKINREIKVELYDHYYYENETSIQTDKNFNLVVNPKAIDIVIENESFTIIVVVNS